MGFASHCQQATNNYIDNGNTAGNVFNIQGWSLQGYGGVLAVVSIQVALMTDTRQSGVTVNFVGTSTQAVRTFYASW